MARCLVFLEHIKLLNTEDMKIIHLSTLWDILKFKHYVVFLFKGPAFFYIPFKISKTKQNTNMKTSFYILVG